MGALGFESTAKDKDQPGLIVQIGPNTEYLKKVAFVSVVVSTVATLLCVLCLPMIYTYAQRVHSNLQLEMDNCQVWQVFYFEARIDLECF